MALVYVYAHGSPWLVYSYVRTLLSAWVLPAAAEGPNRICTPSERHHPVAASKPHQTSSLVSVFTSEGNRLAGRRRASPGARSHRSGRRARGRDRRGARRLWRTMSGCDCTDCSEFNRPHCRRASLRARLCPWPAGSTRFEPDPRLPLPGECVSSARICRWRVRISRVSASLLSQLQGGLAGPFRSQRSQSSTYCRRLGLFFLALELFLPLLAAGAGAGASGSVLMPTLSGLSPMATRSPGVGLRSVGGSGVVPS